MKRHAFSCPTHEKQEADAPSGFGGRTRRPPSTEGSRVLISGVWRLIQRKIGLSMLTGKDEGGKQVLKVAWKAYFAYA